MEIVKIGNVELTKTEAEQYSKNNLYIVTYSKIYQIMYSVAQKTYFGSMVYRKPYKGGIGFTKRGRFHVMDSDGINDILGFCLLAK